jgi:transposase
MSTQEALALPPPTTSNAVVINARCSLRIEADQRVIVVAGLPVHHYRADDAVAEAYAMVFLVESGFAQQTDVARAFGRSVRTVRRYQERYAQDGMTALGREEGWSHGRPRISGKRLRSIEMLKSQGMSNRAIAHRLGVSEKAIRKLVGPSKLTASTPFELAVIMTAAGTGVPSARSTGEDADRATQAAQDQAGDRDPISMPEAVDDGEPVAMSFDRDASDRTLDRSSPIWGCSMMLHRYFARGPQFPVSVSCLLFRVWSRVGFFGSAASSTVKSVRLFMACARRC